MRSPPRARHPLARALRLDKLRIAALEATLALHRDPAAARRRIPALAMLADGADARMARARALAAAIGAGAEAVPTVGRVGRRGPAVGGAPERRRDVHWIEHPKFIPGIPPARPGPPGGEPDPRGAGAPGRAGAVGAGPARSCRPWCAGRLQIPDKRAVRTGGAAGWTGADHAPPDQGARHGPHHHPRVRHRRPRRRRRRRRRHRLAGRARPAPQPRSASPSPSTTRSEVHGDRRHEEGQRQRQGDQGR